MHDDDGPEALGRKCQERTQALGSVVSSRAALLFKHNWSLSLGLSCLAEFPVCRA